MKTRQISKPLVSCIWKASEIQEDAKRRYAVLNKQDAALGIARYVESHYAGREIASTLEPRAEARMFLKMSTMRG